MNLAKSAHFIVGKNGQGKTNLLESMGLVTAARSFRTNSQSALLSWDNRYPEAKIVYQLDKDNGDSDTVEIQLLKKGKRILINDEPIKIMRDFLGKYPTVTLSSDDIQLLRGAPSLRRRFIDLSIASVDVEYFNDLRSYHKGLKDRNNLLKKPNANKVIHAFDLSMADPALRIVAKRKRFFEWMEPVFAKHYEKIGGNELPEIKYSTRVDEETREDYLENLRKNLTRDLRFGSTQWGPHRDDFEFSLKEHDAKSFASEGQQRGLVLSLRLSEIDWVKSRTEETPVILADDILGELDPQRKKGFWDSVDDSMQLIATGTQIPSVESQQRDWAFWEMESGNLNFGNDGN